MSSTQQIFCWVEIDRDRAAAAATQPQVDHRGGFYARFAEKQEVEHENGCEKLMSCRCRSPLAQPPFKNVGLLRGVRRLGFGSLLLGDRCRKVDFLLKLTFFILGVTLPIFGFSLETPKAAGRSPLKRVHSRSAVLRDQ